MGQPQRRPGPSAHLHWKVLVILLYGEVGAVDRVAPDSLVVYPARLARHLSSRTDRVHAALARLSELGILQLTKYHGYVRIKIKSPIGWSPAGVIEVYPG